MTRCAVGLWLLLTGMSAAAELPTLAGPTMGTTYRVTFAADMPGRTRGEVHRDVEAVLARIDRAASTWRNDSDASRFNRASAGEWVTVSAECAALVDTARDIHDQSGGAFDITVGPLVRLWRDGLPSAAALAEARGRVGMRFVEIRPATAETGPALRKTRDGVEIDFSGIAPGYAVDRIGERLLECGSPAHVVEIGGEVRAWGQASETRPWRVWLRGFRGETGGRLVDLADGMAVAASTCRAGRSPIDPRSGRPVEASTSGRTATVRAASCATADAWAVAAIVLDLEPNAEGLIAVDLTPPTESITKP